MDANATVAIDILVRTSMGGAATDFNKQLARMEADVKSWVSRVNNLFSQVKGPNLGTGSVTAGIGGARATAGSASDPAMARAMADMTRMQGQRQKMQSDYTTFVSNQAEKQYRAQVSAMQRGASQFQNILQQQQAAVSGAPNLFEQIVGGNLAARAITQGVEYAKELAGAIFDLGKDAVQEAAHFEVFTNSVAVFSGSLATAKAEIGRLDEAARNTPGLGLETAESGYQRLRALNFQADLAQKLIIGLGKIKLVSGATDMGVDRVIMHLTQLSVSTAQASRDIRFMIRDLPGMKQALVDAFGTIEPKSLKAIIDANPQAFFEKLADAMEKTKIAQPGLTAGWIQLQNAILQGKRVFGGPILEPLTEAVKFLTSTVDQNQSTFRQWGESIGEDVHMITKALESGDYAEIGGIIARNVADGLSHGLGIALGTAIKLALQDVGKEIVDPAHSIGGQIMAGIFEGLVPAAPAALNAFKSAEKARLEGEIISRHMDDVKSGTSFSLSTSIKYLDPEEAQRFVQQTVDRLRDVNKAARDTPSLSSQLQAEKATEEVNKLAEAQRKLTLARAQGEFNVAQATINLNPVFQPSDTIRNTQALLGKQEDFIDKQIQNQKKGYDAEIELNKDDATKVKTIETEKQIALAQLSDQRQVQELQAQKTIEDAERESYNRRREAAIQFYQIQQNGLKQSTEAQIQAVQRAVSQGRISEQQGFATQIALENSAYAQEIALLRAALARQLDDRTKTAEELNNISAQEHLQEQQNATEHQKKLADIEQQGLQSRRDIITQQMDAEVKSIETSTTLISTLLEGVFGERATTARIQAVYRMFTDAINAEITGNLNRIDRIADKADEVMKRMGGSSETPAAPVIVVPTPAVSGAPDNLYGPGGSYAVDATTGALVPNTPFKMPKQPGGAPQGLPRGSEGYTTYLSPGQPLAQEQSPAPAAITQTGDATAKATAKLKEYADFQEFLRQQNQKAADSFNALTKVINDFGGTAEDVDKLQAATIKETSDSRVRAIDTQIAAQERILHLTKDDKGRILEEAKLSDLTAQKRQAIVQGLHDEEEARRKSIEGLREYNAALAAGDKTAVAFAENGIIKDRLNTEAGLREKLLQLQDEEANGGVVRGLQRQVDLEQQKLDKLNEQNAALISIGRSQDAITKQSQYDATQADAAVLKYMADQKGVTQTMADFKIGLMESGYDLIDKGLDKVIPKMGLLHDTIKNLIESFIRLALNSAFRKLFGLDGANGVATGAGGGAGGASGGLGGFLGGILSGFGGGGSSVTAGSAGSGVSIGAGGTLFGGPVPGIPGALSFGGGSGGGRTSTLNPFQQWMQSNGGFRALSGTADTIVPGGAATVVGANHEGGTSQATGLAQQIGLLSKSGLGKFIGSPLFGGGIAGAGIGASLGQGSIFGGLLGGVGGAALGIGATAGLLGAVTPGIFAAGGSLASLGPLAAFFTNPFTIAIGGALLLGAFFIGRAARAKREKKQVTQMSDDATAKIQQLLADVKSFKIDGASAYQQGVAIRDQFAQGITQLKDKGAKRLAQDKLTQINSMLGNLKTEGERADRMKGAAQVIDEKIVPTFAVGGFTGFNYGARDAVVHSSEVILRQQDVMALGGYRRLQSAGVRGVPLGNDYTSVPQRRPSGSSAINSVASASDTYVAVFFDEASADDWLDKVSHLGFGKKVKAASKQNAGGMNDTLAAKLSGK